MRLVARETKILSGGTQYFQRNYVGSPPPTQKNVYQFKCTEQSAPDNSGGLGFVVPCIFNHSNKTSNQLQQSIVKFYCFVVQTLLNMFRALLCPSSGASQTAVAASGFRMNVEVKVFSAVVGLLVTTHSYGTHSYGNQRLQRQFDWLLMMGIVMPETC